MNKNVVKASIFMRENDVIDGVPLYSSIISRAIGCGLSNYIVLRGSAGFGRSGITHGTRKLFLSKELPLKIEIVGDREQVQPFLDSLAGFANQIVVILGKSEIVGKQ